MFLFLRVSLLLFIHLNSNNSRTEAVNKFLENNGLLSVIRAHEAQIDGYQLHCFDFRTNQHYDIAIRCIDGRAGLTSQLSLRSFQPLIIAMSTTIKELLSNLKYSIALKIFLTLLFKE